MYAMLLKVVVKKIFLLLDLACGKGGDIPNGEIMKYPYVGIDVIGNNILDPIGACERYNHYKKNPRKDKKLPEAYFLKEMYPKTLTMVRLLLIRDSKICLENYGI